MSVLEWVGVIIVGLMLLFVSLCYIGIAAVIVRNVWQDR